MRSHLQHGSTAYQCFYDLEKAFDSVEYCVLLDHLYRSGINGRTWRLIKSFYNPCGQVKIGNRLSRVITLQRGVKQGSVLSPMLFLLVMDSLLKDLANANSGISIKGIYTGSLGHADDLRSVTPNLHSLQKQAEIVKSFTVKNSLTLNVDKLDLLAMANSSHVHDCEILIGSTRVTSKNEARYLGVIWTHDLSPKASIEYNINKARRAFFALGSLGVYHGKQNPLTSSEIFNVCILPVCLYGYENWLLTDSLLSLLEDFQTEIGKKILHLPKYHANLCPLIALQWPSMRYRVLIRKLCFLGRLLNPHRNTISVKVFNALREQEQGPLIIEQCRILEQAYHTNTTLAFIEGNITISTMKRDLLKADQDNIWSLVTKHNSLRSLHRTISWPKLWDLARDHGIQGARSLATIFKTLTSPIFDVRSCPHCNTLITRESIFGEHIFSAHLSRSLVMLFQS